MEWTPTPETYKAPGSNILLLQGIYPFPMPPEPTNDKLILYYDKPTKEQYWTRPGPPQDWKHMPNARREEWIESETRRCFITGQWIFLKGQPVWIPPFYWFFLNWWYTKVKYFSFRISQLLEEYFEIFCEDDSWCIGTFRFKKRRDGLTTRRMARKCWKAIQTEEGFFGMQSKTGQDVRDVCWRALMRGYNRLPTFFLPEQSGMSDPKMRLEFKKPSERITKRNKEQLFGFDVFREDVGDDELNTTIDWRDTVADAYDGQQVNEVDLDEFTKWKKADSMDAAYTYIQSATLDGVKIGMIHCYGSPPEKDGKELKICQDMWDGSNYERNKHLKTWKFYRWLTSSLDSYGGACDIYGYCDREKADEMITAQRRAAPLLKRKAVIRQTIRYVEEIFENVDNTTFVTAPQIRQRMKFLQSIQFKDTKTKEPKYIYGNYEWIDKIEFTKVFFKPSENQEDFSFTGRWAEVYQPAAGTTNQWREKWLKGKLLKLPPLDSESVMGIDPYDFRRVDSQRPSAGAAAIGKCFDFNGTGHLNAITALYNFRPAPEVFYMDMLKGAIYHSAWVNAESRNMKIFDFFEDAGYYEYMLMKDITNPMKKDIKGSPTTTSMIQEICSAIEELTATEINEIWHEAIPEDLLDFDPENTKKSNITMAIGHMLLGFFKRRRLYKMRPNPSLAMNNDIVAALYGMMGKQ